MALIDLTEAQRFELGGRMRQLRVSQRIAAEWIGTTQARLSEKLSGRRGWVERELRILAARLDLPEQFWLPPKKRKPERREPSWARVGAMMADMLKGMDVAARQEVLGYFVLAVEGKRPYGKPPNTRLLRALAGLVPLPVAPARPPLPQSPQP